MVFQGGLYPVFTSFFAHNHLISYAEYTAMYLLAWSPVLWDFVTLDPSVVAERFQPEYSREKVIGIRKWYNQIL